MDAIVQMFTDALAPVSALQLAVLAAAAAFAGFIRGFVGFGGALAVIMALSLVLGPRTAVAISCLSGLPTMFQLMPNAIRTGERGFIVPFVLASFAAAPVGTWILVTAQPELMKIAIAVFVLIMVGLMYKGWRMSPGGGLRTLLTAGGIAGLVQGAAGIGGPPAVAVALARPGTPELQRANVIGAVSALAICNLPPIIFMGLFTQQVLVFTLLLMPFYAGFTQIGVRFFFGRGNAIFRTAALAALALMGLVTLVLSVRDYLSA